MTKEEFAQAVTAARETILAFLSNMPQDATVAEVMLAVMAEAPNYSDLDQAYSRFIALDISATQSRH